MTSSNGNVFRVTGHLCGEFTGHRWIPRTKANDAELWFFFDLCLNKRLSKQSWGWWFETPSRPLWRHCNEISPEHSSDTATLCSIPQRDPSTRRGLATNKSNVTKMTDTLSSRRSTRPSTEIGRLFMPAPYRLWKRWKLSNWWPSKDSRHLSWQCFCVFEFKELPFMN